VTLPPHIENAVTERLRAFLGNTAPDPLGLRAVVAKFGSLPVIMDMGGCYALQLDGAVVTFAWDEPHGLAVVDDERLRNIALYQGSRKYPELATLVPARPLQAADCRSCGGTGIVLVEGRSFPDIICFCGGLGWIPASSSGDRPEP
jgi:hypothetical protein